MRNHNSHHLCLRYHHKQGYNYQVHTVFWNVPLEKDCILSNISLCFFGRAAVDEVKVSAILSGKAQRLLHGSISNSLTGTHTNTHTHSHAEYKMRPQHKTISQTGSVIQKHIDKKGKTAIMWGLRGIVVTIHMLLYKEETTPFTPLKRTCIAQTGMVISITLHEAAVWWNGVAARQRQATGHYTTPEWGAIIAEGEHNQVLCLSLL